MFEEMQWESVQRLPLLNLYIYQLIKTLIGYVFMEHLFRVERFRCTDRIRQVAFTSAHESNTIHVLSSIFRDKQEGILGRIVTFL